MFEEVRLTSSDEWQSRGWEPLGPRELEIDAQMWSGLSSHRVEYVQWFAGTAILPVECRREDVVALKGTSKVEER